MDLPDLAVPGISGFTGLFALLAQANNAVPGNIGFMVGFGMIGVSAFSAWSAHRSRVTRDELAQELASEKIRNDQNERLARSRIQLMSAGFKCDSAGCPVVVADHKEVHG